MYRNLMFRFFVLIAVLVVSAGCSTAPSTPTQAPLAAEATQRPAEPTVTIVPPTPTEQPVETSPTASLPTPTPVVTKIVAASTDQFIGTWKWSIQGTPTYFIFKPDGIWEIRRSDAAPGTISEDGEFSFDGSVFTVSGDSECPGAVGTYEAPRIEQYDGVNHRLSFKVIEDTCVGRMQDFRKGFIWSEIQPE